MQYRIWHQFTWSEWKDMEDTKGGLRIVAENLIRREEWPVNIGDIIEIEIRHDHHKSEVMTYRFIVKPQFIWLNTFDPKDIP